MEGTVMLECSFNILNIKQLKSNQCKSYFTTSNDLNKIYYDTLMGPILENSVPKNFSIGEKLRLSIFQ